MKKYTFILAVSAVSLFFVACDKPTASTEKKRDSPAEVTNTSSQDKLIADQVARIQELENKGRQSQEERIKELEQREKDLLKSIAEQKRLAEAEASAGEILPTPGVVELPPVKAIVVEEDPVEIPVDINALPVTDFVYDEGYQPALVENIDYDAYVSYDWYQNDVARERLHVEQEAQCEVQARSILLTILSAHLAYKKHEEVSQKNRNRAWHIRQAQLEREWRAAKAREKEVEALRARHRQLHSSRIYIQAEREKRLIAARKLRDWKAQEKYKRALVEKQRSEVLKRWEKEKKLREERARVFLQKPSLRKAASKKDYERERKEREQRAARLAYEEKRKLEYAKALREQAERERRAREEVQRRNPRTGRIDSREKQERERRAQAAREEERRKKAIREKYERELKESQRRAKEKAEREKAARDKAIREKYEREHRERQRRAKQAAEHEKSLREKEKRERAEREKYERKERERRARELKERAEKERRAREAAERAEKEHKEKLRRAREEVERQRAREEQRRKEAEERAKRQKEEAAKKEEKDKRRNPRRGR